MARTKSPIRKTRSARKPAAQTAKQTASSSQDEIFSSASFSRARDFVEENANLQTAGIALAGAGILALVSTQAGRNLIKTATDAVVNLVSQNFNSMTQGTDEPTAAAGQKPSRQRDQDRI